MPKKLAVLTAGGDCPGINAVIRAVVKTAINDYGIETIGIEDGFLGLVEERWRPLAQADVSGIITQGGTILGTSNKADPFRFPKSTGEGEPEFEDVSDAVMRNFERLGVSALVAIGGDGTLSIANGLQQKGMPVIGIPKTIDNDVNCTDYTFGFDSASATATEAIDKIHTTAQSHHRVMIVELMGRYVGWLALYSGLAGGGDLILIPEIPFSLDAICDRVLARSRGGKRFSIVVVSEGAKNESGEMVVRQMVKDSTDPVRLGGIADALAAQIEQKTRLETRVTVLGHLQRGGTPTSFDRVLATRFGREAAVQACEGKQGVFVALQCGDIVPVPLADAIARLKTVPLDHHVIKSAESVGTSFGVRGPVRP